MNARSWFAGVVALFTVAALSPHAAAQDDSDEAAEAPDEDPSDADDEESAEAASEEAASDDSEADPSEESGSGDADEPGRAVQEAAEAAESSAQSAASEEEQPRTSGDDSEASEETAEAPKPDGSDAEPSSEEDRAEASDAEESADEQDERDDAVAPSVYISDNRDDDDSPTWSLGIGGYLRPGYTHIQNDPNVDFVGRNDGFVMGDARLTLVGELDKGIGFQFQFDGAVNEPQSLNSPISTVNMQLKSTFAYYQPFDELRISLGQFKPPYDVEELTSNSDLLFVTESVPSRGVRNVEGYNVEGLSLTREVGLRVDGEPFYPLAEDDEASGPGVSASLAMTNGQTSNRNLNDNDRLAYYARGNLHWGEYVQLGGAYYYNDKTIGERPDLVDVAQSGWTADLTVDAFGVTAIASYLSRTEDPFQNVETEEGEITASGYQAQIAYEEPFIGFQPAYRYAFYDPSSSYGGGSAGAEPIEHTRTFHTIGLNYNAKTYPVRLMFNYTITQEGEPRDLDNNRFDALLQVTW